MDRDKLIQDISEAMIEGGDRDFLEYNTLVADRLLFKNPTEEQVTRVLDNLKSGLGVQNTLILIECF